MRIGLFGGSFDPIHNGHMSLIKGALNSGLLDLVIVIPAVRNNFKRGRAISPAPYRYYMTKGAIDTELSDLPVLLSDIEFGIPGISYTRVTVEKITSSEYLVPFLVNNGVKKKRAMEKHKFFLICGSDILADFEHWYMPERILSYVTLFAAVRPGQEFDYTKNAESIRNNLGGEVDFFNIKGIEESSTAIKKGKDFINVPPSAIEFIKTHAMYGETDPLDYCSNEACERFYELAIGMYPYLGEKRLLHTLNVGILSAKLAKIHGADCDKALIAGALHDCAKELDIEVQKKMSRELMGDIFKDKQLFHSPAGAVFAKTEFGIEDEEILSAITYHTTGKGDMTTLEKIVFLADKIEPARTYMDLSDIREQSVTNLDGAMLLCARAVREKFKVKGRDIHPLSLQMMKELGL